MLVPLKIVPSSEFVTALIELTESKQEMRELARLVHDPRMSLERWTEIFYAEILYLLAWVLKRRKASLETANTGNPQPLIRQVLSLLPRYGTTLHVVRRAIGFAALGVPTVCGLPSSAHEDRNVVEILDDHFRLGGLLSVLPCECMKAGGYLRPEDTTVVVTGRSSSVEAVTASYKWSQVLGCAGRCCVVAGADSHLVRELAASIEKRQLERSCSRVGAMLLVGSGEKSLKEEFPEALTLQTYETLDLNGMATSKEFKRKTLSQCLSSLHPSVVAIPRGTIFADYIHGYRALQCDSEGSPIAFEGFAADPVYGWPGDYLI
jgi:hypothetical protein